MIDSFGKKSIASSLKINTPTSKKKFILKPQKFKKTAQSQKHEDKKRAQQRSSDFRYRISLSAGGIFYYQYNPLYINLSAMIHPIKKSNMGAFVEIGSKTGLDYHSQYENYSWKYTYDSNGFVTGGYKEYYTVKTHTFDTSIFYFGAGIRFPFTEVLTKANLSFLNSLAGTLSAGWAFYNSKDAPGSFNAQNFYVQVSLNYNLCGIRMTKGASLLIGISGGGMLIYSPVSNKLLYSTPFLSGTITFSREENRAKGPWFSTVTIDKIQRIVKSEIVTIGTCPKCKPDIRKPKRPIEIVIKENIQILLDTINQIRLLNVSLPQNIISAKRKKYLQLLRSMREMAKGKSQPKSLYWLKRNFGRSRFITKHKIEELYHFARKMSNPDNNLQWVSFNIIGRAPDSSTALRRALLIKAFLVLAGMASDRLSISHDTQGSNRDLISLKIDIPATKAKIRIFKRQIQNFYKHGKN